MAKVRTTWQKKQDVPSFSFRSVKLAQGKPIGLSPLASWLDNTAPENVLEELREYQDNWCNHIFKPIASVRVDDVTKTDYCCTECSKIEVKTRAISSG